MTSVGASGHDLLRVCSEFGGGWVQVDAGFVLAGWLGRELANYAAEKD